MRAFIYLIVGMLLGLVIIVSIERKNNSELPTNQIIDSQPVSASTLADFTEADYGLTPDGTFFISTKLIGNPEEVLLTIIESDSTNTKGNGIYEDANNREIIRMKKEGDYFLGKSNKKYLNPAFYFKVEDWKCFPTFMTDKFKMDDIIQNQCGGLLLKKQNKIN